MNKQLNYLFFLITALACACSPTRRLERFYAGKLQRDIEKSPVFAHSYTGFVLLDPENGRTLCDVNGDRLFIPASTNKILTLYTCLHTLGDTLPRLRYLLVSETDSGARHWQVSGAGDPTFLHPDFAAWQPRPLLFAAQPEAPRLLVHEAGWPQQGRWGKGWAWEDFGEDYSPEISDLPLFGNCYKIQRINGVTNAYPPRFQDSININPAVKQLQRRFFSSQADMPPNYGDLDAFVPVWQPEQVLLPIANDSMGLGLTETEQVLPYTPKSDFKTWSVTPADTVYRRMMYESDNFFAEQLLLMCAGERTGYMFQDSIMQLSLPQPMRWVDGSGLSRYNLNSPHNQAEVLRRLWKEQTQKHLFSLFPIGGISGTLVDWYKGKDGRPYIFAKSGSMSGVQCLSGYLVTRRGKVLIFSFMHNNFTGPGKPWKMEMQRILEQIRDR